MFVKAESKTGPIYFRPETVVYCRGLPDGNCTILIIYLGVTREWALTEPADAVIQRIANAGNGQQGRADGN